MKKTFISTLVLSTLAHAENDRPSFEFAAAIIPDQTIEVSTGSFSEKIKSDGYFFKAAIEDQRFRAFGSTQRVEGTNCSSRCATLQLTENRAGIGYAAPLSQTSELIPRVEYVSLDLRGFSSAANGSSKNDGVAIGSDLRVWLSKNFDLGFGASYIRLKDYTGSEFIVGAKAKTSIVDLFADARFVNLSAKSVDGDIKSNEVRLGASKVFDL